MEGYWIPSQEEKDVMLDSMTFGEASWASVMFNSFREEYGEVQAAVMLYKYALTVGERRKTGERI